MDPISLAAGGAQVAGSLIGGYFADKAAKRAERAQTRRMREAMDFQRENVADSEAAWQPYTSAGTGAVNQMSALMGLQGAGARSDAMGGFYEDPGYLHRLEQGEQALTRSNNALGNLGSGTMMADLAKFNQGEAANEYGNYYNRLGGLAGQGMNATNALTNARTGVANNLSDLTTGMGMAEAHGAINQGNAWQTGAQGAADAINSSVNRYQQQQNYDAYVDAMRPQAPQPPQQVAQTGPTMLQGYTPAR